MNSFLELSGERAIDCPEEEIVIPETAGTEIIIENDTQVKKKRKNKALERLSRLFGVSYQTREEIADSATKNELLDKIERLKIENDHLKQKLDGILSCPICNEMVSL